MVVVFMPRVFVYARVDIVWIEHINRTERSTTTQQRSLKFGDALLALRCMYLIELSWNYKCWTILRFKNENLSSGFGSWSLSWP